MENKHCLQCGEELDFVAGANYCNNAACPNYGLYQMGIEDMPPQKEGKYKKAFDDKFPSIKNLEKL
jgi:hypothetical protein